LQEHLSVDAEIRDWLAEVTSEDDTEIQGIETSSSIPVIELDNPWADESM
jgi:hypothetical protein